ncbi:MAG TPA: ABC transporter substrate-binding protein [Chloroflexota bacterium]|nr:ABC transporter substrate-binding protein [Chloroflexota bacterium]
MNRQTRLTATLLLASLLAACSSAPAALPSPTSAKPSAAASGGQTTVRFGTLVPSTSDAAWLIAEDKGWFAEQGIKLEESQYDSAANMVAPLGSNQLDVGGGAPSAGLFNAINRGVNIIIGADKGSNPPGHGFQGLLLRPDLAGKVKTAADLKGLKLAIPAEGVSLEAGVGALLDQAKLTTKDVDLTHLAFPDMLPALANKSIDGAFEIEPFLTNALSKGLGVLYQRSDKYAPNQQVAVLLLSPGFAAQQDVAERFMSAYLKGICLYDQGFEKNDPAARAQVIDILSRRTNVKDKALYEQMVMPGFDPSGKVNSADLKAQQAYYISAGEQQKPVDVAKVVDLHLVDAALQKVGACKL